MFLLLLISGQAYGAPQGKKGKSKKKALPPKRAAMEVKNVAGFQPSHFIISPKEEGKGDIKVKGAPELDIRSVSAHNDKKRLRITIYLHNPVNFKKKVGYIFRLKYANAVEEYYGFNPNNKRMFYEKVKKGKMVKFEYLKASKSSDYVTLGRRKLSNGKYLNNCVIILFLDKDKHFTKKDYGKTKNLTVDFASVYLSKKDQVTKFADRTKTVRLSYKR